MWDIGFWHCWEYQVTSSDQSSIHAHTQTNATLEAHRIISKRGKDVFYTTFWDCLVNHIGEPVTGKRSVLRSRKANARIARPLPVVIDSFELKTEAQKGIFKHLEVARSSRRAPQHAVLGSHIPPILKQVVLQRLAPSQLQDSTGPTSKAAYIIYQTYEQSITVQIQDQKQMTISSFFSISLLYLSVTTVCWIIVMPAIIFISLFFLIDGDVWKEPNLQDTFGLYIKGSFHPALCYLLYHYIGLLEMHVPNEV